MRGSNIWGHPCWSKHQFALNFNCTANLNLGASKAGWPRNDSEAKQGEAFKICNTNTKKDYTSWGRLEHAGLHPKKTMSRTTTKKMSCPKTKNILLEINLGYLETNTFLSPLSWIKAVHLLFMKPWQVPTHAAHRLSHAGSCHRRSHHTSLRIKSPMVPHHLAVQVQGTCLIITTYLANILFGYQVQKPVLPLSWVGMFGCGRWLP